MPTFIGVCHVGNFSFYRAKETSTSLCRWEKEGEKWTVYHIAEREDGEWEKHHPEDGGEYTDEELEEEFSTNEEVPMTKEEFEKKYPELVLLLME